MVKPWKPSKQAIEKAIDVLQAKAFPTHLYKWFPSDKIEIRKALIAAAKLDKVKQPPVEVVLETRDQMLYVGGSKTSFRCSCGSNVFRKVLGKSQYACNGCKDIYTGKK